MSDCRCYIKPCASHSFVFLIVVKSRWHRHTREGKKKAKIGEELSKGFRKKTLPRIELGQPGEGQTWEEGKTSFRFERSLTRRRILIGRSDTLWAAGAIARKTAHQRI